MLYVNPLALMYRAFQQPNGGFYKLMRRRMGMYPSTPEKPWRLVLYSDEVVPGNQLSHDNKRKCWVVYFSWLELGMNALCCEDAWMSMFIARSSEVATVAAGMSQIFRELIKTFFGANGHNAATAGVVLVGHDGAQHRLFFDVDMFLQDGGAHKTVWHCTGDAGSKLCMLCKNLYVEKSGITDEDGADQLTSSLIHDESIAFASNEEIRGAVRRLAAHRETDSNAAFKVREQAIGYRYQPYGILMDRSLDVTVKPADQFCHDWMHTLLVHGVFNVVVCMLFEQHLKGGMPNVREHFCGYAALYTWPKRVSASAKSLSETFSEKRKKSSRKANYLKCQASDALSLYPVLAFYVQCVLLPTGLCVAACEAYIELADIMDLLMASSLGVVPAEVLRIAVDRFLRKCVDAGWRQQMIPKFHWLIHLPRHLARFGCLPTCWVHERKHRMVKRYATDIQNTRVYERSVVGEVTCHYLADIAHTTVFDFGVGLVTPKPAPRQIHAFMEQALELGITQCETGRDARISDFATCSRGDVALLREAGKLVACRVLAHTVCDGEPISLVAIFRLLLFNKAHGAAEWEESQKQTLVSTGDIECSVIHCRVTAGVRTLIPVHLRSRID
jgi:hypothetical protein